MSMKTLTDEQRSKWAIDGYLQLEQVLSPDEVAFFNEQLDRMRKKPGWEPDLSELPIGHYGCFGGLRLTVSGVLPAAELEAVARGMVAPE